jgi:phage terminase large subunit GpA-like protein
VPCPDCGHYQYLGFREGIVFDHCKAKDGTWDLERVERETRFKCAGCGSLIPEEHKAGMIAAGKLVYIDPANGYTPLPEPPAGNTSRTLQIPATYSLFTSWGTLAKMFLEAVQKGPDSLRVFITDELAEPYEEAGDRPDLDAVRRCIDDDRNPGQLPHGEPVIGITCGVDVQEKRVYWVVRAFGYEDRSWLLRYGWIPREGDKSLALLNSIIFAEYDGKPVHLALIDSGYDKDAVYNYCRSSSRRAVPSKGRAELIDLVKLNPQDKLPDGKPDENGLLLSVVNVTHFKTVLHERIAVKQGEPREWRLHNGVEDDYLVHMISEYRRPRPGRGPLQYDWVHDKRYPNHYFDAEVMALAGAKLMGWNFVQEPKEQEPRPPKPRPKERNPWEPQVLGHLIQNPFAGRGR